MKLADGCLSQSCNEHSSFRVAISFRSNSIRAPFGVARGHEEPNRKAMRSDRSGQIVVIFLSIRTQADDAGYGEAAAAMGSLAAMQPGYRGFESTRGADGLH